MLEGNSTLRASLMSKVIDGKMWPAQNQVTNFPSPPRVPGATTGACGNDAAEIADRPVVFLTWHSNPWSRTDEANLRQTYPGHDYVVAYWMGRNRGFIAEDTPSSCLHK